jgi:hypothetical protein
MAKEEIETPLDCLKRGKIMFFVITKQGVLKEKKKKWESR